jgi:uncharacterized protein DUF4953/uncharacterized protein DUF5117
MSFASFTAAFVSSVLWLGCGAVLAQTTAPAPTPGAVTPVTPATGGPPAATPSPTKPFDEVVKNATSLPGYFNLYEKDDKVWIELKPGDFDKPFFFASNLHSGIGENLLYGGLMGNSGIARFHKIGNQVQLLAVNTEYFAKEGTPEARAVAEGFSDSLLASAPLASQPHPTRNSVLVEANALMFADIPGANGYLERIYRQPYAFDARNSSIVKARVTDDLMMLDVSAHYALARVVQPPVTPGPTPFTQPPATVPDIRSLFLVYTYNFAKLPEVPMRPRRVDDRVGYFLTSRMDYSDDNSLTPKVQYVHRWRLEKKDPSAALSEVKQPIVFWLDRTIPERYRVTVVAGVLEWNKAFERIGFKDAVQVKIQPDDADFDTTDTRHASIRWMTSGRAQFGGIGPSQVDPRTGEILDADIGIDPARIRNRRFIRVEQFPPPAAGGGLAGANLTACNIQDFAASEVDFALDVLEARGEIAPDSDAAEDFILADLKEVVMHEVGHTLGLRHNFRASTIYTEAQLSDPVFTKANGVAGSVMEYNAINIALPGERQGEFGMATLGPYDYWAIEYGYRQLDPVTEEQDLKAIAARSNEPSLAFSTDQDANFGIDPEANTGDLGNDPLSFISRRLTLTHELWDRWQKRRLQPGESYVVLRRNISRGIQVLGQTGVIAAKYIGGVSVLRDHAGSPRAPLTPIAAAQQRQALDLLQRGLFAADSFRFSPEFMRRAAIDYNDPNNDYSTALPVPSSYDYSLPLQVLGIQRTVLNQLMSDTVAQRILDSEVKLDNPRQGFHLSELYDGLQSTIWSELKTGQDIPLLRRNLQQEHLQHMVSALLHPPAAMPADARSLMREAARTLTRDTLAASRNSRLSKEAHAHLIDAASTLDDALKAPMQRAGA